jgi:hypothetical protein
VANERGTIMVHTSSVQNRVYASEDRALMIFSAWLLACVLLLENDQQPR